MLLLSEISVLKNIFYGRDFTLGLHCWHLLSKSSLELILQGFLFNLKVEAILRVDLIQKINYFLFVY